MEVTKEMVADCTTFCEFARELSEGIRKEYNIKKGDVINLPTQMSVKAYAARMWFGKYEKYVDEAVKLRRENAALRTAISRASTMISDWNASVGADEYEKRCAVQTVLRDEVQRIG